MIHSSSQKKVQRLYKRLLHERGDKKTDKLKSGRLAVWSPLQHRVFLVRNTLQRECKSVSKANVQQVGVAQRQLQSVWQWCGNHARFSNGLVTMPKLLLTCPAMRRYPCRGRQCQCHSGQLYNIFTMYAAASFRTSRSRPRMSANQMTTDARRHFLRPWQFDFWSARRCTLCASF